MRDREREREREGEWEDVKLRRGLESRCENGMCRRREDVKMICADVKMRR